MCVSSEARTALKAQAPNPAGNILGTTPTEIHARFAGVIEQNFRTGDMNKIVHNMSGRELADLAAVYKNATGTPSVLLQILAKGVDADGLTSVASAFGQEETAAAVATHAPAAVAKAFTQLPVKVAVAPSVQVSEALTATPATVGLNPDINPSPIGGGGGAPPTSPGPNVGMTPTEIYLDFRTAPGGSNSILVALYETAMFMGGKTTLGGAAALGTSAGKLASQLIQTYDPTLDDAIGGTIANMLDQISNAATEVAAGQIQAAWDALFAIPNAATPATVPVPPTSAGDFGVTTDMADYTDTTAAPLPSNAAGGSADSIVGGGSC